jgi:uncharacterized tellurite resistance protein B-like protein
MTEPDPRRSIARLAVAILKADGTVTAAEIDSLRRLDELGGGSLSDLAREELALGGEARAQEIDLARTCEPLLGVSTPGAAMLLEALAEIAASDRRVTSPTLAAIDEIARRLFVPPEVAAHVLDPLRALASERGPAPPRLNRSPAERSLPLR